MTGLVNSQNGTACDVSRLSGQFPIRPRWVSLKSVSYLSP
jgi:hypothetical protein